MNKMSQRRSDAGTVLALVVVFAIIIIICGIGIFLLARMVGGGHELQNSIDAGNLNVAKEALASPAVTNFAGFSNGDGAQFGGVADSKGGITLNNINRVYAQAYIVASNAYAMQQEGSAGPSAMSDAGKTQLAANSIGEALTNQLSTQGSFVPVFANCADGNSLRMLGSNQKSTAPQMLDHQISYTDRACASNVRILDAQIAGAAQSRWKAVKSTNTLSVKGVSGSFPLGYMDGLNLDGTKNIAFVPLKNASGAGTVVTPQQFEAAQPHHISQTTFFNDQPPSATWTKPVPNAFWNKAQSKEYVTTQQLTLRASAVAKSMQPSQGFAAALPYGFIRVVNMSCSGPKQTFAIPGANSGGQDVFTFLNATPVIKAVGPQDGYFIKASDPTQLAALDNIIKANKASQDPDPNDLKELIGPHGSHPSLEVAKQITGRSEVINNFNADLGPLADIESAFNVGSSSSSTSAPCAASIELANFDLLSQRTDKTTANINISGYYSGIAAIPAARGPLPAPGGHVTQANWQFTAPTTMGAALTTGGSATDVTARIIQRCYQIDPAFNGNLNSISGWNSTGIPLGGVAYIYFVPSGQVNNTTGIQPGNLVIKSDTDPHLPAWLKKFKSVSPDGTPAAFDVLGQSVSVQVGSPSGVGGPAGVLDVNGDWGFPHPWDGNLLSPACNKNTFVCTPSTGYNGLLLEVQMGACFGVGPCGSSHGDASKSNTPIAPPSFGGCKGPVGPFTGPC